MRKNLDRVFFKNKYSCSFEKMNPFTIYMSHTTFDSLQTPGLYVSVSLTNFYDQLTMVVNLYSCKSIT